MPPNLLVESRPSGVSLPRTLPKSSPSPVDESRRVHLATSGVHGRYYCPQTSHTRRVHHRCPPTDATHNTDIQSITPEACTPLSSPPRLTADTALAVPPILHRIPVTTSPSLADKRRVRIQRDNAAPVVTHQQTQSVPSVIIQNAAKCVHLSSTNARSLRSPNL